MVKYEVMDGCPDRGEVIPIRMYMNGIELAPSYENIHNRLNVKYWINLVLMDEEERRYFKQTEITIYRKPWEEEADHKARIGIDRGLGKRLGYDFMMYFTRWLIICICGLSVVIIFLWVLINSRLFKINYCSDVSNLYVPKN